MHPIRALGLVFVAVILPAAPAADADTDANFSCAAVSSIYEHDPKLGAFVFDRLVVEGMHYFDEHHVLGEGVHIDFSVMKSADEIGFFRAWCTANPTEHIADAMRALYRHMADLSTPGAAASAVPPPPQGAPPPSAPDLFVPRDSGIIYAAKVKALNEPLDALAKDVEHLHPVAMFFLAKRFDDAGRKDEALFWFYEGQLRWRAHLVVNKDEMEQAEYDRLFSDIGLDINAYAARNVPLWLATIDKVLAWDSSHPDDFTPAGPARDSVRAGLLKLKDLIVSQKDALARKVAEDAKETAALGDDPYGGSGGAPFGTPQEMVPAYDAGQFAQFRIGITTKKDVVAALGKPEMWITDKDGTSTLNYPYHMTDAADAMLGMSRRIAVGFKFDSKKVLMAIVLPKDQAQ